MKKLLPFALALLFLAGCRERVPLIDKQLVFDRYDWWDNRDWDWYSEYIPFIETPDAQIDEVYYYRWEVMTKHLTYGSPETGYMFTEFIDRPFWSGMYGGIACPLGHQLSEVRWLKNPRIIDDFSRYWIDTEGARPRNYSNWYGAGLWQIHEVWGDVEWITSMLPYMEEQVSGWFDEHFDADHGLFYRTGHDDGMEVNINSRQAEDERVVEGYRPTLNAYLYGDLTALSRTAELAGEAVKATEYAGRAAALKTRVLEELWDDRRQFFLHQWVDDHPPGIEAKSRTYETGPFSGNEHGRELIGYVPWQFNLPDSEHSVAWKYLMDPEYFKAPYGPTTTEQNDPQFYVSPNCCVWSGQSWPYATTQTLVAMANLLNNYEQNEVDAADYAELLHTYTRTQYKDNRPYIAESANPFDGSWFGSDMPNHSEHYLHSGYVDLILSGLFGIRASAGDSLRINPLVPGDWDYFLVEGVPYHGYELSLIWDRDGTRYDRGAGFTVLLDGKPVLNRPDLGPATLSVPPRQGTLSFDRPHNLVVNNGRHFPEITASYSHPSTPVFYANDGGIWYHQVPINRWTTINSPNTKDWIAVDFGAVQTISEIKLYFIDDEERLVPPASYAIEAFQGGKWTAINELKRHPELPTGRRANTVSFDPLDAEGIRVLFTHAQSSFTGLSEIEAWTPAGATINPPTKQPPNVSRNLALNPDNEPFPRVSASFAPNPDGLAVLIDGSFGLTTYQANRWTANDTPNLEDWVQVDFDAPKAISRVDVYLWGDSPRYLGRIDSTVSAPRALRVRVLRDGEWIPVDHLVSIPESPQTMARNSMHFDPVESAAVRVYFEHDLPSVSGATEIQIW